MSMKIISWNVNGIRAAAKKNFFEFLEREKPDILCVQETKAKPEQIAEELLHPLGYMGIWNSAERPGYSGVATFVKEKPLVIETGLGIPDFDTEGRLILTKFEKFTLMNIYFPNGGMGEHRVKFKLDFYDHFLDLCQRLRKKGENLILCGDYNTAHNEIDLARPHENEGVSGFLPIERAWMDKFFAHGYIDTFRELYPDKRDVYTWWSMRAGARPRNVGWRIDYFCVNKEFLPSVKDSYAMSEVQGSDHCPIVLEI